MEINITTKADHGQTIFYICPLSGVPRKAVVQSVTIKKPSAEVTNEEYVVLTSQGETMELSAGILSPNIEDILAEIENLLQS